MPRDSAQSNKGILAGCSRMRRAGCARGRQSIRVRYKRQRNLLRAGSIRRGMASCRVSGLGSRAAADRRRDAPGNVPRPAHDRAPLPRPTAAWSCPARGLLRPAPAAAPRLTGTRCGPAWLGLEAERRFGAGRLVALAPHLFVASVAAPGLFGLSLCRPSLLGLCLFYLGPSPPALARPEPWPPEPSRPELSPPGLVGLSLLGLSLLGLSLFGLGLVGLSLLRLGLVSLSLLCLRLVGLSLLRLGLVGLSLFGLSLVGLSLLRLALVSLSLVGLSLLSLRLVRPAPFGLSLLRLALVSLSLLSLRLVGLRLLALAACAFSAWPCRPEPYQPAPCRPEPCRPARLAWLAALGLRFPGLVGAGLTCLASLRLPLRLARLPACGGVEPGVPEPAGAADCSTRTLSPCRAACCGSAVTAAACAGATVPAGT